MSMHMNRVLRGTSDFDAVGYDFWRALPALPASLFRFLGLVGDSSVSVEELTSFIWTDPALLSRAVALATTLSQPGDGAIRQSICDLGRMELRRLAFTTPVLRCAGLSGTASYATAFWERSQACAVACETAARELGSRNPERCYVAGMLHDIGYLILLQNQPAQLPAIHERSATQPARLLQIEAEVAGMDHCEAGIGAAQASGLPEWLWPAIAGHHRATPGSELLTRITAVGSAFCAAQGLYFLGFRRRAAATRQQQLQRTLQTLFPDVSEGAARRLMEKMKQAVQPICRTARESIIEVQLNSVSRILSRLVRPAQPPSGMAAPSAAAAFA